MSRRKYPWIDPSSDLLSAGRGPYQKKKILEPANPRSDSGEGPLVLGRFLEEAYRLSGFSVWMCQGSLSLENFKMFSILQDGKCPLFRYGVTDHVQFLISKQQHIAAEPQSGPYVSSLSGATSTPDSISLRTTIPKITEKETTPSKCNTQ